MTPISLSLILCLQQSVMFHRSYTVGDKDVYVVKLEIKGTRAMSMGMTETMEVTKLLEDGGAEVSVTVGDMSMNGNPLPSAAAPKIAMKQLMNSQGFAYKMIGSSGPMVNGAMFSQSNLLAKGIKVGETIPFEYKPKTAEEAATKGKIDLVSLENGVAALHIVADATDPKGNVSHVDATFKSEVATGRVQTMLIKIHSDAGGGTDMDMDMERKVS